MRADDDVVIVDDQIPNRCRRHVESQRLPVVAVVEGDVDRSSRVPANSSPFRTGSSRTVLTTVVGNAGTISVHVSPPSCVR